jgi:hypothetical protein
MSYLISLRSASEIYALRFFFFVVEMVSLHHLAARIIGHGSDDVETLLKPSGNILDGAWDRPVSEID